MIDHVQNALYFLPVMVSLLGSGYFFARWHALDLSQKLFSFILLCLAELYFLYATIVLKEVTAYLVMLYADAFTFPLLLLLMFGYVDSIVESHKLRTSQLISFFVVPLLMLAFAAYVFQKVGWKTMENEFIETVWDRKSVDMSVLPFAGYLYVLIYTMVLTVGDVALIIYAFVRFALYDKRLRKVMADSQEALQPIRRYLLSCLVATLMIVGTILVFMLVPEKYVGASYAIYACVTSAMIFYVSNLALVGYMRPSLRGEQLAQIEMQDEAVASVKNTDEIGRKEVMYAGMKAAEFGEKLDAMMTRTRLYMKPNVTIYEVAEEMGTNRTYMSQYLNNERQQTFFEYVYDLRIQREVLPLLEANPSISAQELYYASGFRSTATFYRHFEKVTGKSMSVYRNQNQ